MVLNRVLKVANDYIKVDSATDVGTDINGNGLRTILEL